MRDWHPDLRADGRPIQSPAALHPRAGGVCEWEPDQCLASELVALVAGRMVAGVGFVGAAGGLGTALGPAIGGGIGQALGWPALFWLDAVWAAAVIPVISRVITDTKPAGASPCADSGPLGGHLLVHFTGNEAERDWSTPAADGSSRSSKWTSQ